jgi:hypothetical protein
MEEKAETIIVILLHMGECYIRQEGYPIVLQTVRYRPPTDPLLEHFVSDTRLIRRRWLFRLHKAIQQYFQRICAACNRQIRKLREVDQVIVGGDMFCINAFVDHPVLLPEIRDKIDRSCYYIVDYGGDRGFQQILNAYKRRVLWLKENEELEMEMESVSPPASSLSPSAEFSPQSTFEPPLKQFVINCQKTEKIQKVYIGQPELL